MALPTEAGLRAGARGTLDVEDAEDAEDVEGGMRSDGVNRRVV
jgi:hypothetical protein